MFSPKRCLADSNCCRRFCRPLTKPLIQGTIIKFACKGNTIIRSFQTNHVFFSFFAPTVPQQLSEGNGENGGSKCIAALRHYHQSSVNRAAPFLSHPCRTSPTMRRPCLINASPRLSDPCGTSAALPLPRPSLATKRVSFHIPPSATLFQMASVVLDCLFPVPDYDGGLTHGMSANRAS